MVSFLSRVLVSQQWAYGGDTFDQAIWEYSRQEVDQGSK